MKLHDLLEKASRSGFRLRLLNLFLARAIPFNAPHKVRIKEITKESIRILLPYIRINKNHIRGMHACALATLSEYVCGLTLARNFHTDQFRLIMKELQMTYHYQGKTDCYSEFALPQGERDQVKEILQLEDSVFRTYTVEVFDSLKNHISTAKITWQLKRWEKTKVN